MSKLVIYTDGACSGNPGPGGYGAVLKFGEHEKEIKGGFRSTTNNRMEILAVIEGLKALKKNSQVTVYSDSKYVIDTMTKGWALNWKRKNWMRTAKDKAKNSDLWEQMLELEQLHEVQWKWVKGHAGDPMNERADRLAVEARDEAESHQVDEVFEKGL
jgi:ribonuclease HI